MQRRASCACGDLVAVCSGDPAKVSLCHCLACQRRTGSTYGIAAFFHKEEVSTQGAAATYSRPSDSGHDVRFSFCPRCGSTVYWQALRKPEFIAVAVGAFADPSFPAPAQAVYDDCRHWWVAPLP